MGQEIAAVVIACILQRAQHINSAGGYLRVLTEKARAGEFSVGPMLIAALRANGVTARNDRVTVGGSVRADDGLAWRIM
jgi:replication initiation protein RepC